MRIFNIQRTTELDLKMSVFMSENQEDQLDMYAEAIADIYDLRKENDILIEMVKRSEEKYKKLKRLFNVNQQEVLHLLGGDEARRISA